MSIMKHNQILLYLVDCYLHGYSLIDPKYYEIKSYLETRLLGKDHKASEILLYKILGPHNEITARLYSELLPQRNDI